MTSSPQDWKAQVAGSPHFAAAPIDRAFYAAVAERVDTTTVVSQDTITTFDALPVAVRAGHALSIELLQGAQVVNLFAFNANDPDERIWLQSLIREGLYLTVGSRIWGTMAWNRPLLTVVVDTVVTSASDIPFAQHHPIFGSETPADWRARGGAADVDSTWAQFTAALNKLGLPPATMKENVSLFQKAYVDGPAQRLRRVRSDAVVGDRVSLFAEIDLVVLLAASPFIDGGNRDLGAVSKPRAVQVEVRGPVAEPLGWPYQEFPYPDLREYVDDHGRRTERVKTNGKESQ